MSTSNLPLNPFDDAEIPETDYHGEAEEKQIEFESKELKGRQLFKPEVLFFIFRFFRKIYSSGGQSIVTEFDYKGEKHIFQTRIQADADTINFIPDIEKYDRDAAWRELYEQKITEHFIAIDHFFVKLYASVRLWGVIAFIPVLLFFNQDFLDEFTEMIGDEDGDGQIWDMNDFGNNERDIGNEENSIFQHHYLEPYIGHYECYYNKYDFYFQLAFVFFTIFVRPWLMGIVLKIGGFFAGKLMPLGYKIFAWWKNRKKKKKNKKE